MSKVYVTQVPHRLNRKTGELEPLDLSAAEEWGELNVILTPGANPFTSMDSIIDDLHASLQGITPDDYLVLVGNPAIMSAMAGIAADYCDGKLKVLQWHGKQRKYNLVEMNLN